MTEVPLNGNVKLGPFDIDYITLTHSIAEPNGLAIRTDLGTVFHTGDWKIDEAPITGAATDISAIRKLGDEGLLAMVCDSTNVFVEGRAGSEDDVRIELENLLKTLKKRVAVACFASNVARVEFGHARGHAMRPSPTSNSRNLPPGALDPRSRLIILYAMCGFANFGSLGIMIAGLSTMAPERRDDIVSLGLKSIVSGTLATCLMGAIVGVLT